VRRKSDGNHRACPPRKEGEREGGDVEKGRRRKYIDKVGRKKKKKKKSYPIKGGKGQESFHQGGTKRGKVSLLRGKRRK